jgi:Notch-like protein
MTSSGYDEVPPRLLKLSILYFISPLTYLCNKSHNSGIFPSWLKYSQITPILKKGNKSELSNYRPISLLASFSKIFEKVIYKRLVNHASAYNILSKAQYGFRTNMSTDNAIYQLTNNILKALDNK